MQLKRQLRYSLLRLKRLSGSPRKLAMGTAIGVFVGFTPTVPFHTVLILSLCFVTGGSAIAGIIVSWLVCNPLTFLPIYSVSALIGNFITPWNVNLERIAVMLQQLHETSSFLAEVDIVFQQGGEFFLVMLAGSLCTAFPMSILSYFLGLRFFTRLEKRRRIKRILQQKQIIAEKSQPSQEG